ncbi:hypothetical protein JMG10_20240 [Nostoc ellipsosporum NOK]|nr:hypothetical protein [Nostoc ellipsosporum NOK]
MLSGVGFKSSLLIQDNGTSVINKKFLLIKTGRLTYSQASEYDEVQFTDWQTGIMPQTGFEGFFRKWSKSF